MPKHDYQKSQGILTKHSKEQCSYGLNIRNIKNFNILFIQELPWLFIYIIPSSSNKEGDKVVDASNHHDHSRIILYINIYLIAICFSLQKTFLTTETFIIFLFLTMVLSFL